MGDNTRLHDLIVGVLVFGGTLLGVYVNLAWLWVPGIVGVLLITSFFTGFCPVYYALDKLRGKETHGGHGAVHH